MDFNQRVIINTQTLNWEPSPMAGVKRKKLERESAESGRATSVVRYAPNSKFSAHEHPAGEEIFVLEGVFSDEHSDYPAGTYFRNPPGTSHSPHSKEGCTLLVKLCQFDPRDTKQFSINTNEAKWLPGIGGLKVMPLHSFEHEHVALVKWPAGEVFQPHRHFGGEEIYVLSGEFKDEFGSYPAGTWMRSPHLSQHTPFVEEETVIWVKTGHLPLPY